MKKRIKVFLGGYINSVNAQNFNCLALARHLDPEKFEVRAMTIYSGNSHANIDDIPVFKAFYPYRLSKYIVHFQGIMWADVVYLPKGLLWKYTTSLIKLMKKKSFVTVEGIFDEAAQKNAIALFNSIENMKTYYQSFDKAFSITHFMKEYNKTTIGLPTEEKVLYLGTEIDKFLNESKQIDKLSNIIMIGNDLIRKGVEDLFILAERFSDVNFHIVGSGNGKIDVAKTIAKRELKNVNYYGTLNQQQLAELLKSMDLHLFPSHSEGFPKVTLETAAAGVPSMVYSDYGANEWIEHNKNGFVLDSLEEMEASMRHLQANPKILQNVSKQAIELAKRFDWNVVIKDWENVILELAEEKTSL